MFNARETWNTTCRYATSRFPGSSFGPRFCWMKKLGWKFGIGSNGWTAKIPMFFHRWSAFRNVFAKIRQEGIGFRGWFEVLSLHSVHNAGSWVQGEKECLPKPPPISSDAAVVMKEAIRCRGWWCFFSYPTWVEILILLMLRIIWHIIY